MQIVSGLFAQILIYPSQKILPLLQYNKGQWDLVLPSAWLNTESWVCPEYHVKDILSKYYDCPLGNHHVFGSKIINRHCVVTVTVPPLASRFSCTLSRLSSSTSAMYWATFFTTLWTARRHKNTPCQHKLHAQSQSTPHIHPAPAHMTHMTSSSKFYTNIYTHQKVSHIPVKVISRQSNV